MADRRNQRLSSWIHSSRMGFIKSGIWSVMVPITKENSWERGYCFAKSQILCVLSQTARQRYVQSQTRILVSVQIHGLKMVRSPCWLPRGQQVSHQKWICGTYCTQVTEVSVVPTARSDVLQYCFYFLAQGWILYWVINRRVVDLLSKLICNNLGREHYRFYLNKYVDR